MLIAASRHSSRYTAAMAESGDAIRAALRAVSFLSILDDKRLDELVDSGRRSTAAAGEVIFNEGDAADLLHVLLSGSCRVYRRGDDDGDVNIATIGPGEAFGELALLDGGARSASVAAVELSELFSL